MIRVDAVAVYVGLLRGINVGGTGLLAMKDLIAICSTLGFGKVRTYIQSGNVIFESGLREDAVRIRLEDALEAKMGKKIAVMIRTSAEMRAIVEANPFSEKEPNRVAVVFLAGKPPDDRLDGLTGPAGEQVRMGVREVYVYYPEGIGRSKLKLPLPAVSATVRNINTVSKLVQLAEG